MIDEQRENRARRYAIALLIARESMAVVAIQLAASPPSRKTTFPLSIIGGLAKALGLRYWILPSKAIALTALTFYGASQSSA